MPVELPRAELRYLLRGGAGFVLVGALLVGWWASPWSPVALDRPAMHLAQGDLDGAIGGYVDLARGHGPASVRAEALWRAAMLTAVDAGRVQDGILLFRELQERWPASERAIEADARLAALYQQVLGDELRAAEHWRRAAAAAPSHRDSGRWLLDAGLALASAGRESDALAPLQEAASRSAQDVAASLALGRLYLALDPGLAWTWYDRALRGAASAEEREVARMGLGAATERMDLRGATADLGGAGLPVDGSGPAPARATR
jgi:tetratricopeptide (TPR) repeat protein